MDIDLKQFSNNDLLALQAGDLTKLSTPGLKILQRQQRIAQMKKDNPGEYDPDSKEWKDKYGPTLNMTTTEKVLAGAGKAFMDVKRGVGQLIGTESQADIDEAKRTDAPLMDTTAGKVGNIGGNVAIALPAMFVPGANTVAGAALTGAAQGFVQPVADGESRLKNTAIGGAAGAGGVVAGRTLAAGAKGAKALVEPFTAKGRDAIAARTLERFGVAADDVAQATSNPTITGARTTMAEQITRPEAAAGAARLQDSLRALDPEIAAKMTAREVENNAARVSTLRELAGEGGEREFYQAARSATSKELYDKAFKVKMHTGPAKERIYHGTASEFDVLSRGDPKSTWGPADGAGAWLTSSPDDAARFARLKTSNESSIGASIRPYEAPEVDAVVNINNTWGGKPLRHELAPYLSDPKVNVIKVVTNGADAVSDDVIHYWVRNPEKLVSVFDAASSKGMSAAEHGEITKLFKMPAIQNAMKEARTIAANKGINISKPDGSIEGLHLMKLAMDDAIEAASKGGSAVAVNKAMSIKTARDRLVTFMERMAPEYGEARATHAAMSKPINQMDVADALFKKGTSSTSDLGGTPRLMPDKFVNLLKNEEQLVKSATGRDLGKLSQVLEPEQFEKVIGVGKELDKLAAVGRAANGPGSATAQRMSSQNVLRQILGPTGLPESWAESTLLNTAMRPVQFAYSGVAEPKIQAVLADLVMNPARAQAVLQAAKSGGAKQLPKEVQAALPYLEQALKQSAPAAALAGQR